MEDLPITGCEPFIEQDGYDSGLVLCCNSHNTQEPVLENHLQAYHISLRDFQALYDAHKKEYGSEPKKSTNYTDEVRARLREQILPEDMREKP